MKLLPRLRYILEVIRPSPRVVQDVLGVLIRIARHSSSAATQVTSATLPTMPSGISLPLSGFISYKPLDMS
jgi:hypothetical protein